MIHIDYVVWRVDSFIAFLVKSELKQEICLHDALVFHVSQLSEDYSCIGKYIFFFCLFDWELCLKKYSISIRCYDWVHVIFDQLRFILITDFIILVKDEGTSFQHCKGHTLWVIMDFWWDDESSGWCLKVFPLGVSDKFQQQNTT